MSSLLLIEFINVYIQMMVPIIMIYYIICNSFTLKIAKRKAYLWGLFYAQYIPLTDALSFILVGERIIPNNGLVYILLKINIVIEILLFLLFIVRYTEGLWYKKYWWPLILVLTVILPELFYTNYFTFWDKVNGVTVYPVNGKTMPLYILIILIGILWGCIFLAIGKRLHKYKWIAKISKKTWYLFYFCYAVLVAFSKKDYFIDDNPMKGISNYKNILVFVMAALVILFTAINQTEKRVLRIENNMLLQQKELQYNNSLSYQQQEQELIKLYQEIENHIKSIQQLIVMGMSQEAKDYTKAVMDEYSSIKREYYCCNKIINAVLISKAKICINKNISCHIDIQLPEHVSISDIDLMSVFSNLLDNAIEGCLRNTDAENWIDIKAATIGNFFSVRIINSKLQDRAEALTEKKRFMTWKENKKLHGYGLKIIEEVVERYEGQKEFNDLGDTFSSLVMLKIDSDEVKEYGI